MATFREREWSVDRSTEYLTDEALSWLPDHADQSFFLWFHYFDPHMPYAPPHDLCAHEPVAGIGREFDDRDGVRTGKFMPDAQEIQAIRNLYEAEVHHIDEQIGRFIAALRANPLGLLGDATPNCA